MKTRYKDTSSVYLE